MKSEKLSSLFCRSLFSTLALASLAAFAQWSVTLETTNLSFAEFEFGTADGATAGWDAALEDPLPPALPNGAISGFSVNGAPFPWITLQDFRATGINAAVYVFSYSLADNATATLDWSAPGNDIAPLADLEIRNDAGANLLGAGQTMATVSSLQLKASREGTETIYFIFGAPQPVARDDVAYVLNQAGLTVDIDVLTNDYSPAMSPLEVVDPVVANPTNGVATVLIPADSINYDPNPAYFGVDTFTYKATDGISDSAEATVTVYVNENIVIRPRADQEPGKPGEPIAVTVDVECNPALAGVALEILLPRTQQDPPQIWGFVGATYSDNTRADNLAPGSVVDDGLGTVTLGFDTLPTSLTLTLLPPDARVASSPIVFDKAAGTVANLATAPFPDALPEVKVPMQFGTLDVDENGEVNMNDVIFVFRRAILGTAPGIMGITPMIADNVDALGDMLDVDENGEVNMNDVIFIFRRAILGAAPGTMGITQAIADNVDAMMP